MESFDSHVRLNQRTVFTSTITCKPLTLAIVLLLVGLAPAAAIIGFCTRMSCCAHGAGAELALTADGRDCCTTITCYEAPSATQARGDAPALSLLTLPVPLVRVPTLPAPHWMNAPVPIDTSPPPSTRHRLAELSTLLI